MYLSFTTLAFTFSFFKWWLFGELATCLSGVWLHLACERRITHDWIVVPLMSKSAMLRHFHQIDCNFRFILRIIKTTIIWTLLVHSLYIVRFVLSETFLCCSDELRFFKILLCYTEHFLWYLVLHYWLSTTARWTLWEVRTASSSFLWRNS